MKNIITASLILLVLLLISVGAQQPPKPVEFKLNAEASKVWANIDQAQAELRRQYDQLEGQRAMLLIGAGIPADSRQCRVGGSSFVVCAKPEAATK